MRDQEIRQTTAEILAEAHAAAIAAIGLRGDAAVKAMRRGRSEQRRTSAERRWSEVRRLTRNPIKPLSDEDFLDRSSTP